MMEFKNYQHGCVKSMLMKDQMAGFGVVTNDALWIKFPTLMSVQHFLKSDEVLSR